MNKNIYAHTDAGTTYPAFVSINEQDAGLSITVRSRGAQHVGVINLDQAQALELANAILANYPAPKPKPAPVSTGKKDKE